MKLTEFSYLNEIYQNPKDKVTIIGMANNGPILRPFFLEEGKSARELLGDCQLTDTYEQLELNGVSRDNIIIHRLNGNYDTIYLKDNNDENFFKFKTITGNDSNKLIELNIQRTGLIITKYEKIINEDININDSIVNEDTKILYQESYIYEDYQNLSQLADAINQDASLGIIDIIAKEEYEDNISNHFKKNEVKYFENSSSESAYCLSNEDDYSEYKKLYWEKFLYGVVGEDFLEKNIFLTRVSNIKSELYIFTDVYYDLFPEAGMFCAKLVEQIQKEEDLYLSALISTSLCPDKDEVPTYYSQIEGNKYYDENGDIVTFDNKKSIKEYVNNLIGLGLSNEREETYMSHLQVIIGTEINLYEETETITLGGYGGTYLKNNMMKPISNKEILYNNEIKEEIFKSDIASLTNYGYIYIVPTIRKGIVAYRAQAFDKSEGMLKQLNNKRIIGAISLDLRNIFDIYIGTNRKKMNVPAISKILTEYFDIYVKEDIINGYTYNIPQQLKWDSPYEYSLDIELSLFGELHKIMGSITAVSETKGGITVWEVIQD